MLLAQDLRDAVLQAALQGKLTEQFETDSSVDKMLESIKEEKKQLIKEKKIKKEKALPPIEKNDIPFGIPDSWRWIRLAEIGEIIGGGTPKTTESAYWDNGSISWITPADMNGCGMFIGKGSKSITEEGLINSSAQLIPKDSVIISSRAPIGYIAISENELTTSQGCKTFSAYNKIKISSKYIYFVIINSISDLIKRASGTTFKEISGRGVGETIIPLPSTEEQQRIVDRVAELMKKIDEYEKVEKELVALEQKFTDDMKNALLQAAMQGKLTEQLDSDSSVDEMLETIKKEKEQLIKEKKIKKERALPLIGEDEIPFDIPENWKWERFANIAILNPRNNLDDALEVSFIPMTLISDGYNNEHTTENRMWKDVKKGFTHIKEGDLGFAKITPCFQNRKSVIFKNLVNGYAAGTTELYIIRAISNSLLAEYLLWFVKSPYFVDGGVNTYTGTAGQQRIHKDYLPNCLVPVPPIEEQQRIVERLEQLLPLCETL